MFQYQRQYYNPMMQIGGTYPQMDLPFADRSYQYGQLGFSWGLNEFINIFSAAGLFNSWGTTDRSWGGGGSSSSSNSVKPAPKSSYDKQIETLKTEISDAKEEIAEDGTLKKALETAEKNQKLFNDYSAKKKVFDGLGAEEPQKPEDLPENATPKQKADAKTKHDAWEAAKEALEAAKRELEAAGINTDETETSMQAKVSAAQKAIEDKNAEISDKEYELKKLQENAESELGLSGALNQKDGSWLKRQVDGKDTLKDKMAAFRKASDKFMQNPYSLSNEEIQTLENAQNLKTEISSADNTESSSAILKGLDTWIGNDSKKAQLERAKRANEGKITYEDFEELSKYGYFKKSDRQVGDKLQTVYTGGGQSYIVDKDNKQLTKLNKTQNGNVLHKAKFEI